MNEKFSFFTSLVFVLLVPLSEQAHETHQELLALRAVCFYESHLDLPWENAQSSLGFRRQSDGKFYKLSPQEQPYEP